ncbi:DUF3644 domain-containing protein [uncultured Zoogloea sp.]|uniref:DUF3644 domain-containing protein n=1 Tax=uncultured Zoogloea sp. TaxID=160237 RepID=UPI002633B5AA|nr:DUF3644 domain-containing protein [uncultured Zoogloea sp.]
MPKLKKNVAPLLEKGTESLTLAIELFNRPTEIGRTHGVLILMQHAFEMLLKASILQSTGSIHDREKRYTYGFDRCLTVATEQLKVITTDERATLSILDAQRDQAAHYYVEMSEDILYVHAQSGVTLFNELLKKVFGVALSDKLPSRILPISIRPPRDLVTLFANELAEVDRLLTSGKRQGAAAAARLRTILAFTVGSRDGGQRVPETEIAAAIAKRRKKNEWEVILPEVAQLRLSTDGSGIPITMRISKDAPIAVRIAKPGEEVAGTVIKQQIDPWDVYTMSRDDLASKLSLTGPRTHALIYELNLQADPECYKELRKKSQVFKGYSKKALDKLRQAKEELDIEDVWARHRTKLVPTARRRKG